MKVEHTSRREPAERALLQVLRAATNGAGPFKGASTVAREALESSGDVEEAIDRLIGWHVRLAATSGAVTSIGDLITLPVTLPDGVGGHYLIAVHLAAGVAYLRGYDPDADEVQTALLLVALGSSMEAVLREAGVTIGTKSLPAAISKLPGHVLMEINRSVVNLGRMLPLIGVPFGGTVDWAFMRAVGSCAKEEFPLVTAPDVLWVSAKAPDPWDVAPEPRCVGMRLARK